MSVTLTCPQCGVPKMVADELLGKRVRCKKCETVFVAESADVEVVDDEPDDRRGRSADVEVVDDEPDDRPRRIGKPHSKKAKRGHGPAYYVGLAVAALLAVGAIGFVAYRAGVFGPKSDSRVKLDANGEPEYVAPDERIKAPKAEDFSQHVRLRDLNNVAIVEQSNTRLASIEVEFLNGKKPTGDYYLAETLPNGETVKHTQLIRTMAAKTKQEMLFQFGKGATHATVWVGKIKYLAGNNQELIRVSNTVELSAE
jgi:hypothetical protein